MRLDPKPENPCFGCGGANPRGMRLAFEQDDARQRIVGRFRLGEEYQGGSGFLHGGIIALLLDEAMSKASRFHTRSGVLLASRIGDWIELDFPATREQKSDAPSPLLESLGIDSPRYVGKNKFDYLVEVGSEDEVRRLKPDHAQLRQLPVRGVMVTSRAKNGEYDFVSRFFAPGAGVDEDPVTGSAHCCLGPFWKERLGRDNLLGYQASARGGVVRVRVAGDRVVLGGRGITVLDGELRV